MNPTPFEARSRYERLRFDPEGFLRLMTMQIEADPSDGFAYFCRHQAWLALGRSDRAVADLDQAIAIKPNPVRLLARGRLQAELGLYAEALADFDAAESLDGESWRDLWGPVEQAHALAALGRGADGLRPTGGSDLRQLQAHYDLLRSAPERFIDIFTGFIAADPAEPSNYFNRHLGWLSIGRHDLALEDLDRAISLRPTQGDHLARGIILAHLGRHEEALETYAEGEALNPEAWLANADSLHQAVSHAALGREAEALAFCERLPNDFWSGVATRPSGSKEAVTLRIQWRARTMAQRRPT